MLEKLVDSHCKNLNLEIEGFGKIMNDDELAVLIGNSFKQMLEKVLRYYSEKVSVDCINQVLMSVVKASVIDQLQPQNQPKGPEMQQMIQGSKRERPTSIGNEALGNLHEKSPSADKLNEINKTQGAAIKDQNRELASSMSKRAIKEIGVPKELGDHIEAVGPQLQKKSHQCHEQTQILKESQENALLINWENVFDQVELKKFLQRVKLANPQIKEKHVSLPSFVFGQCHEQLIGKISLEAQWVETDAYFYYG